MPTLPTPEQRVLAIFANQFGAISHAHARAAGLSNRQIEHRVLLGLWRRPVKNVYVLAGSPDTWQQRAMVAYLAAASAGGVVSYVTAAAFHGLLPPSPLPHITVPSSKSARCRAARIHRGNVPPEDRQRRDGLLITTPSRPLADMAGCLARSPLEELVDDVLCQKLASPQSITASLERAGPGRRGRTLLREVLNVWTEKIEPGSIAEIRLLRLLGELGLTGLVTQYVVNDDAGAFVARLDLAAPELCRGLEYDSVRYHSPHHWARDEPRYERLTALGWEVDAVTKLDLVPGEPRLRTLVPRWVEGRAA